MPAPRADDAPRVEDDAPDAGLPGSEADRVAMRRALELAQHGEGAVEPNPMVGCVLTHGGQVVGEGWHQAYGGPHAEVNALQDAGPRVRGATAYVTLEPCRHTGKTPPCTGALLQAGVARVVVAVEDPHPRAGGGLAELRAAGVRCDVGVEALAGRKLLAPYLKRLATGRPWVLAKWAMTLDGKLATATGDSQWISSEASRRVVHELRGRVDAVVVGAGTARADDPLLTARPAGPRVATRVVLGGLSPDSRLAQTTADAPVLVVVEAGSSGAHAALASRGVELLEAPAGASRGERLAALLDALGARGMTNVLIEGGAAVLGAAFDAGLVDEAHVFIAPRVLGGGGLPALAGGAGPGLMRDALTLRDTEVRLIEGDVYLRGRLAEEAPRPAPLKQPAPL